MTTVLGGDDSPTDRLVVNGSTVGDTSITVTNAGGACIALGIGAAADFDP